MNMRDPGINGYSIHQAPGVSLLYKNGLDYENIPLSGAIGRPTNMKGRRPIYFLEPDLIIRELVHGGAFARLTRDLFLSPQRSLRELIVSSHLINHGIRTPEILAIRMQQAGLCVRIRVISRLVPGSIDVLSYLQTPQKNTHELFERIGGLCRQMHDLRVYHTDLQLKNFLLDQDKHLWLLDLDNAWLLPGVPEMLRKRNHKRFFRSCHKWQSKGRIELPENYQQCFFKGYNALRSEA